MSTKFHALTDALEYRAKENGEAEAFIFRDRHLRRTVLTWADLYKLAGRFAYVLRHGGFQDDDSIESDVIKGVYGVGRGDLVVNTLPNSPERVVCETGIMLSGAASVNGMCQMKDGSDLLRTLSVSHATAILLDPDISNSPWNVLSHHVTLGSEGKVTQSSSLPDLKKVYMVRRMEDHGSGDFLATLESRHSWFKADDFKPDDVLSVFTTSGSTGFSKLVIYSHAAFKPINVKNSPAAIMYPEKRPQKVFNMAPLGWLGGSIYDYLMTGNTRVLIDDRDESLLKSITEVMWRSIQEEPCTRAFMTPKYLQDLSTLAARDPAPHIMDKIVVTGMPVNGTMVRAALVISKQVCVIYGSIDFGLLTCNVVTDWGNFVDYDSGPPAYGVKVKIVSHDDEKVELPINHKGNILIQTDYMPKGYLNDPQANADLFTQDGWVRTGDVGRLDERGHLIVEGRGSDAIMRGAYIHYPAWIEQRLRACPLVREVMVVGIPDPFLHEELCACVVLESQGGADEEAKELEKVRAWVSQEITADENDLLSPRPRFYLSFPSLPHTYNDKPRRQEAKKMAVQRLGLA